jgi:hypothetical protein
METVKADDAAKLGNFNGTSYVNPKLSPLYKDARHKDFLISYFYFALVNYLKDFFAVQCKSLIYVQKGNLIVILQQQSL